MQTVIRKVRKSKPHDYQCTNVVFVVFGVESLPRANVLASPVLPLGRHPGLSALVTSGTRHPCLMSRKPPQERKITFPPPQHANTFFVCCFSLLNLFCWAGPRLELRRMKENYFSLRHCYYGREEENMAEPHGDSWSFSLRVAHITSVIGTLNKASVRHNPEVKRGKIYILPEGVWHNHITMADARRQEGVTLPQGTAAIILNNNILYHNGNWNFLKF